MAGPAVSIKLIQAVLEHPDAPTDPGRRFVLVLLAYFANDDGTQARPETRPAVPSRLHMRNRTVRRHLTGLHASGWIARDHPRGPGQATVWRVLRSPQHTPPVAPDGENTHAKSSKNTRQIERNTRHIGQEHTPPHGSPPRQMPVIDAVRTPPRARGSRRAEVMPQVLPMPAPGGAEGLCAGGELEKEQLDALISAVGRHPRRCRSRDEEPVDARKVARGALDAGWPPELVAAALAEVRAFTSRALTFAISRLRRAPTPASTRRAHVGGRAVLGRCSSGPSRGRREPRCSRPGRPRALPDERPPRHRR